MRVRFRRGHGARDNDVLSGLQADLELLREENVRLKADRQRVPDASRVAEDMRELSESARQRDTAADDAWHVLTEALVIRETLLDACQGIEHAMATVASRLRALAPSETAELETAGLADRETGNGKTNGSAWTAVQSLTA